MKDVHFDPYRFSLAEFKEIDIDDEVTNFGKMAVKNGEELNADVPNGHRYVYAYAHGVMIGLMKTILKRIQDQI